MNKLVIVSYSHINEKDAGKLGLDFLCSHSSVDYIDVTAITGDYGSLSEIVRDDISIYKPITIKEFKELLKKYGSKDTILFHMSIFDKTIKLYEIVSSTNCRLAAFFSTGVPPLSRRTLSIVQRVLNLFNYGSVFQVIKKKLLQNKTLKSLEKLRKYDIVFYSGEYDRIHAVNYDSHTSFYGCNYIDYERINKTYNSEDGNYIVFIDQYEPFHPDSNLLGLKKVITPNLYYDELNAYFSIVEEKYNCKVVIAAHPKAEKYKNKNYYAGREVYFGKTVDLVRNAKGVIFHNSTSVSCAIIFNKPVLQVYTSQMKESNDITYIHMSVLGREINIKAKAVSEFNDIEFEKIQPYYRDKYLYNYLTTPESKDRTNGEIIAQAIERE